MPLPFDSKIPVEAELIAYTYAMVKLTSMTTATWLYVKKVYGMLFKYSSDGSNAWNRHV